MEKGIFIMSIDLELAWGFNDMLLKGSNTAAKYLKIIKERSRRNVKKLLKLSERFNIPFSWGVVGHLFLSSCSYDDNYLAHRDMARPQPILGRDWYSNDPRSDIKKEPLWYGSDLVNQILDGKVEHEVACHTFSHVDFSRCSKEVARAEIRKCREVMKDYGLRPRSFIFPRNRIGHLDILKQEGFTAFRFKMKPSYILPSSGSLVSRLFAPIEMASQTFAPKVGKPVELAGMTGIPSFLLFQSPRSIDAPRLLVAARRGLHKAISERSIFHITMHDYLETDRLIDNLSKILSYVARMRDENKIRIDTIYSCGGR